MWINSNVISITYIQRAASIVWMYSWRFTLQLSDLIQWGLQEALSLDSPDLDDKIFQWNCACVHALGHKLAKTYSKQGVQSPDHILEDKNKLKNINKNTTLTTLYAYYVHIYTMFILCLLIMKKNIFVYILNSIKANDRWHTKRQHKNIL